MLVIRILDQLSWDRIVLEESTGSLLVIINYISYELNKWEVGGGLTAPTPFLSV